MVSRYPREDRLVNLPGRCMADRADGHALEPHRRPARSGGSRPSLETRRGSLTLDTGRSQMTHVAREQNVEQAVRLRALFTAFLIIALCGVGGGSGIVWARRIAVENRRWISDRGFADIVSLCQFMPGPNIIGIA